MISIAIYTIETGRIHHRITCDYDWVDVQYGEGQDFYLNCPDDATHIIEEEPVKRNSSLGIVKKLKRNCITSLRDQAETKPFLYRDKPFDADAAAIKRITLAVQAAQLAIATGNTFSITWTCADNSTIDLDQNDMAGLLQAMVSRGNDLHIKARQLKDAIEAATAVEEVEAITWEGE